MSTTGLSRESLHGKQCEDAGEGTFGRDLGPVIRGNSPYILGRGRNWLGQPHRAAIVARILHSGAEKTAPRTFGGQPQGLAPKRPWGCFFGPRMQDSCHYSCPMGLAEPWCKEKGVGLPLPPIWHMGGAWKPDSLLPTLRLLRTAFPGHPKTAHTTDMQHVIGRIQESKN